MTEESDRSKPSKASAGALFAVFVFIVALAVTGALVGYHVRSDLAGIGIGIMAISPIGLIAGIIAAAKESSKK